MNKDNYTNELAHRPGNRQHMLTLDEMDKYLETLPEAPNKETIKRLLIQLPAYITDVDNESLQYKKSIGDLKVVLKAKKSMLEIQKSTVRKKEIETFKVQYDEYMRRMEELTKSLMESKEANASLKKAYLTEMSKVLKPQSPTSAQLDDLANIQTASLQEEINDFEKQINEHSMDLEMMNIRKEFYENMWMTIRKYTDVVTTEMRMLGEN